MNRGCGTFQGIGASSGVISLTMGTKGEKIIISIFSPFSITWKTNIDFHNYLKGVEKIGLFQLVEICRKYATFVVSLKETHNNRSILGGHRHEK